MAEDVRDDVEIEVSRLGPMQQGHFGNEMARQEWCRLTCGPSAAV